MKKTLTTMLLVLIILSALLTGTLAVYSKSVELNGSVVAKDFIFLADGTENFRSGVKIAPTEVVTFEFGLKNYDGAAVSETPMRYDFTVDVVPAPGKEAIMPLIVSLKDERGNVISSLAGTGKMEISNVFPLLPDGQRHGYKIEFTWPGSENDIDYQGDGHETQLNVTATAIQSTDNVHLANDGTILMGEGGFKDRITGYSGSYSSIVIPKIVDDRTVYEIYQDVFNGKGLTSVFFSPDSSVSHIHARAFKNNDLTEITLAPTIKYLDYGAFLDNFGLKRVTIGEDVLLEGKVFQNSDAFATFYKSVGKTAGTYVYENGTWTKQ